MGSYFKKLRLKSGLSQRELAEKLGWSNPQFVSNIERGVAYYPKEKLPLLEDIFKVPMEEMVRAIIKFRYQKIMEEYAPKD